MQAKLVFSAALVIVLLSLAATLQGADSAKTVDKGVRTKQSKVAKLPSDQDIGNAKSQGLVWVDPDTRVYYKAGDLYGRTKRGKFATEDDAKKEGVFEAKEIPSSEKGGKKRPDQSGIDSSIETHSSTAPRQ
jgi:hypothetical protein